MNAKEKIMRDFLAKANSLFSNNPALSSLAIGSMSIHQAYYKLFPEGVKIRRKSNMDELMDLAFAAGLLEYKRVVLAREGNRDTVSFRIEDLEVREWQAAHTVESELAEFDQAFAKIEKEDRLGALL